MKNLINFEDYWSDESRDVVVREEFPHQEISKSKRKRRDKKEGLWFKSKGGRWSKTIPSIEDFDIYYDGGELATYLWPVLFIHKLFVYESTHMIKLKREFPLDRCDSIDDEYRIENGLSFDDFEIVENPKYRG